MVECLEPISPSQFTNSYGKPNGTKRSEVYQVLKIVWIKLCMALTLGRLMTLHGEMKSRSFQLCRLLCWISVSHSHRDKHSTLTIERASLNPFIFKRNPTTFYFELFTLTCKCVFKHNEISSWIFELLNSIENILFWVNEWIMYVCIIRKVYISVLNPQKNHFI